MGGGVARFDVVRLSLVMDEESFAVMFEAIEPRLRRALVAWYGPLVGKEAAKHRVQHAESRCAGDGEFC